MNRGVECADSCCRTRNCGCLEVHESILVHETLNEGKDENAEDDVGCCESNSKTAIVDCIVDSLMTISRQRVCNDVPVFVRKRKMMSLRSFLPMT